MKTICSDVGLEPAKPVLCPDRSNKPVLTPELQQGGQLNVDRVLGGLSVSLESDNLQPGMRESASELAGD